MKNSNSGAVKTYVSTIYGHKGSAAQTYATKHGITFVDVDSKLAGVKYSGYVADATVDGSSTYSGKTVPYTLDLINDESKVPEGKGIAYWDVEYKYSWQDGAKTLTWKYNTTSESNTITISTPETAGKNLLDQILTDKTISCRVGINPVYDYAYNITVINGTASKYTAIAGQKVRIIARDKEEGDDNTSFAKWRSEDVTFANELSNNTTFIMPGKDVTVKAGYRHRIYVTNGYSETISAKAGDKVNITAAAPDEYSTFTEWTSDDVTFDSELSDKTYFIMPDKAVNVTAHFKSPYDFILVDEDCNISFQNADKTCYLSNYDQYYSFLGLIEYLKERNKADYTVSGTDMSVDVDKNGTDDIKIDTKNKLIIYLNSCSLKGDAEHNMWSYTADDAELAWIEKTMKNMKKYTFYRTHCLYMPYALTDKGRLTCDLTAGGYKIEKPVDNTLIYELDYCYICKVSEDEKTIYYDINCDEVADLCYFVDKKILSISENSSVEGVCQLSVATGNRIYILDNCEKNKITEYYSAFDIKFPSKIHEHVAREAIRENVKEATCIGEGSYDEVIRCSVCGEIISNVHKTLPAAPDAHDWGDARILRLL